MKKDNDVEIEFSFFEWLAYMVAGLTHAATVGIFAGISFKIFSLFL